MADVVEEAPCADASGRTPGGVAGPLGWSTVLTHERVAISLLSVVDVSTHIVTHQDEQKVVETELSRLANTCKRMQEYWHSGAILDRTPLTPMIADLKQIDGSQWRRLGGGDDRASVNCKLFQQWFPRRWGASAPPPSDWLLLAPVDWSTVSPAAQAWRYVGRRACSSGRAERGEISALGFRKSAEHLQQQPAADLNASRFSGA